MSKKHLIISEFTNFCDQAARFVYGNDVKQPQAVPEIEDGSVCLVFQVVAAIAASLTADIAAISAGDEARVSVPDRVQIARQWNSVAQRDGTVRYAVGDGENRLLISKETPLKPSISSAAWVRVERYFTGIVEDVGGAQTANIHIRLAGESKSIKIEATRDMLRGFSGIYENVTLKASFDVHLTTGERRNFHLLEIVNTKPKLSAEARRSRLAKLVSSGREAWKTVADHNLWLRELRGEI